MQVFQKKWFLTHAFAGKEHERGICKTVHLGSGPDLIFCTGWNEPATPVGTKRRAPKVFIATAHSAAVTTPWMRPRHILRADEKIEKIMIAIPQPIVVKQYFAVANVIDIANQYRQGLLAIEKIWSTHNLLTRIFQTVMGMILCNALLAYKHFERSSVELDEFVQTIVKGLISHACIDEAKELCPEAGGHTKKVRECRKVSQTDAVEEPNMDIRHALYSCKKFGRGSARDGKGTCRIRKSGEAYHFCETCSRNDDSRGATYYICAPGYHDRHCYTQHLYEMLHGAK